MDATLAARFPLVCPACRTRSGTSRDMHTLSVELVVRQAADGDIEEGTLRCDNAACARRYPIVDGTEVPPELIKHARRAADACPTLALLLESDGK